MSVKMMVTFLVTFVVVYVAISLIDTGSIYWVGLVGSLIGAVLGMFTVSWLRRDHSANPNHDG